MQPQRMHLKHPKAVRQHLSDMHKVPSEYLVNVSNPALSCFVLPVPWTLGGLRTSHSLPPPTVFSLPLTAYADTAPAVPNYSDVPSDPSDHVGTVGAR